MKYFSLLIFVFFSWLQIGHTQAPTPQERSVQVSATTQVSPPQITLNWVEDSGAPQYVIHRKGLNDTNWGSPIATLSGTSTSYTDNNVQVGIGYEYAIFKEDFNPRVDIVCFSPGTPIEFTVYDQFGIGLCCSFGQGFYEVKNCGNVVAYGDDFGSSETTNFTTCNDGNGCSEITVTVKPDMIENSTYWIMKNAQTGQQIANGGSLNAFIKPRPEYGFIYAGIDLPAVEDRGRILLVIENDLQSPLVNEIGQLKLDLIKDGWRVDIRYVDKDDAVTSVHSVIKNVYNQNSDLNAVFLLGNIPVPFSGSMYPDTHVENEGAYPADVYYGEMNGTWTDNNVNTTSPFLPIYHNVPGDGKFDQNFPPSGVVELQVGRVDLSDMSSFADSEIELIRKYLVKNHDFKTKAFNPQRRGLVDDNFNQSIAAPAASGYRNFATMFGANNVVDADYFSTMSSQSYLWSYACGSGNANSMSGVGSVNDFVSSDLKTVFTMMFGSQLGNWEFSNAMMKAPLASGQTLANCWAGNPPWALHHMSMGYNIGYSLLQTQNNINDEYLPAGPALTHTSLLGDPSLRMHMVRMPTNVQLTANNNSVNLSWSNPSETNVVGYNIYRASDIDGVFTKINSTPINGNTFVDNAPFSGTNVYQVKTVKLETSGSGTYNNLSLGALKDINFNGTVGGDTTPPTATLSTSSNNVTASFIVNISFSENVNGVELSDFQIVNGFSSNLSGNGSNYVFTITPNATGNVNVVLLAQTVTDLAGNNNVNASNTLTVNYANNNNGGCNNPTNLALNKSTQQINTQQGGVPSRAVDGNTNGDYYDAQSVTLTNWTAEAWWQVDLGNNADIQEIKIWNRTDCCAAILSDYYILVSSNPFTSDDLNAALNQNGVEAFYQSAQTGLPSAINIGATGRYVRVQLATQGFLALAEVEVIGCNTTVSNTPSDQSIIFAGLPNKVTTDAPFSINASASSGLPVSFSIVSGPANISSNTITLTGNTGTVMVRATQSGNAQYNAAPDEIRTFTVSSPTTGGGCTTPQNLALGKSTNQSSIQFNGFAGRAVDGNTDGNFWGGNSTTLTEWNTNQWWEVDLGEIGTIETINIWNRTDCCMESLSNYYVFVSDVPFTSTDLNNTISQNEVSNFLQNSTAGRPTSINVNRSGRYVRVQIDGVTFLALSEVEVMGCIGTTSCPPAGTSCDDSNPNTTNDIEDGDCNCAGTPVNTGNNCANITNVAINKTATQSSTLAAGGITGSANKAIDGNSVSVFFTSPATASSVSATQNEFQAWWQVDLGTTHLIENINIYNRVDGTDRTRDCYVMISETPFTSNDLTTARSQAVFEGYLSGLIGSPSTVNPEIEGRYVRVQLEAGGFLVLGEVEVEGCVANIALPNNNNSTSFITSEYLHFEASKDKRAVQLQWITDMELQNEYFIIEKSLDGHNFDFLMEVDSRTNTTSPKFYVENDYAPQNGINYYRLRQVLKDGTEILSPIYEVAFDLNLDDLVVFPNPAKDKIFVNLKKFLGKKVIIKMYDARGILQTERKLDKVVNELLRISLGDYNNGFYMMSIEVEGQKRVLEKVIIEKGK